MIELTRLLGLEAYPPTISGPLHSMPEESSNAAHAIEQVARSMPTAIAVEHNGRRYSYRDLLDRSFSVATAIREMEISPGAVIAVQAPRGFDFIACVIAILACGCVFLPIGEGWPQYRVNGVLRKARVSALLHTGEGAAPDDTQLLDITTLSGAKGAKFRPVEAPEPHAAYIYFTSGSTGEPKGAVNTHAGLANHLHAKIRDLKLSAADRVAQNAPSSFDISLWQMLAPLCVGATVLIIDDDQVADPTAFVRTVCSSQVTVLEVVPSLMSALIIAWEGLHWPANDLRWLMLGGEPLKPSLVRRWLLAYPDVPVVNAYGPTEAADDVCHHVVRSVEELPTEAVTVPVGKPLPNTHIAVLREGALGWHPVDSGEVGEIFASGIGVGIGYISDDDLTKSAFFEAPNSQWRWRVYRTGDLGYIDEHGVVTCVGRTDRQVKVRGVRIELDELESAASSIPRVDQSAVIAARVETPVPRVRRAIVSSDLDSFPERRVVICFVVTDEENSYVRRELAQRLPASHLPDATVTLSELPRSRNGKVDYAALERQYALRLPEDTGRLYPPGTVGAGIEDRWASIVGIAPSARSTSILDAGGDSLAAILLSAQVAALYGRELPARLALRGSLDEIVRFAEIGSNAADGVQRSAAREDSKAGVVGHGDSLQLTLQQEGVFFHLLLDPDDPYYRYQGEIVVKAPVDVVALRGAWRAVSRAHRHFSGRAVLEEEGAVIQLGDQDLPLREIDLRYADEPHAVLERLRSAEIAAAWDIEEGPLLKAVLALLPDGAARLVVTMPELTLDAWGSSILASDLQREYGSARGVSRVTTPDRVVQLQRFSAQQRTPAFEERLAEDRRYWRERTEAWLASAENTRDSDEFSFDPGHVLSDHRSEILERTYSEGEVDVEGAASVLGVTPFAIALTALSSVMRGEGIGLGRLIGIPHSVRTLPGSDEVSAFLVNMLPYMPADPPLNLLDEVVANFDQFEQDREHSQLTLGGIVEQMSPQAIAAYSRSPFSVMLNMPNVPSGASTGDTQDFEFVETWTGYAKYPLCVYVQQQGGLLVIQVAFVSAVVSNEVANRILEEFVSVLRRICDLALSLEATKSSIVERGTNVGTEE